jgi:hypothetical protein
MPKNKPTDPTDLSLTGGVPVVTAADGTKNGTDSHVAGHEENDGADD